MIGFGLGGILMGRLVGPLRRHGAGADRRDRPVRSASSPPAHAGSLWQFALAQGLLIGMLGASAGFAPLVADTSLWFTRRRGIAVAICASGNYLAGAVWPPILQHYFDTIGWRATFTGVGLFCVGDHDPARVRAAAQAAGAGLAGEAQDLWQTKRHRHSTTIPAAAALRRGRGLLRRDVDAAGAHRRLLRRPGLPGRARRGDALGDARLRHRQPPRSRAGSATASAACARCCSAPGCRASRCSCSCRSTASPRCTSCRRCSASSRAASCPPTRSSCASTSRPRRPAPRWASSSCARCSAWRWAAGCRALVFDLTGSYRAAFLNGIGWNLLNLAIAFYLLRRSLPNRTPVPA